MSNTLTATITFSFKGKTHSPSVELDVDEFMQKSGRFPDLYMLIAKAGNYDLYSYEYEMMQAEPVLFSKASGLVADYVIDGVLDILAFEAAWIEHKVLEKLQLIAQNHLSEGNLDKNLALKTALLEAYRLGKLAS